MECVSRVERGGGLDNGGGDSSSQQGGTVIVLGNEAECSGGVEQGGRAERSSWG